MKHTLSLTRSLSAFGEYSWCTVCASVVLLGHVWNVLIGAPEKVLMAYVMISFPVAFVILVSAARQRGLRDFTARFRGRAPVNFDRCSFVCRCPKSRMPV